MLSPASSFTCSCFKNVFDQSFRYRNGENNLFLLHIYSATETTVLKLQCAQNYLHYCNVTIKHQAFMYMLPALNLEVPGLITI